MTATRAEGGEPVGTGDDRRAHAVMPAKAGIHAESEWTPAFAGPSHKLPAISPSPSGEGLGWGLSARLTGVSEHSDSHSPPQPLP
jgi:hypothetical protein